MEFAPNKKSLISQISIDQRNPIILKKPNLYKFKVPEVITKNIIERALKLNPLIIANESLIKYKQSQGKQNLIYNQIKSPSVVQLPDIHKEMSNYST